MSGAVPPRLESARLRLDPLHPSDARELLPILRDPRLYTYLSEEPPTDLDALVALFERYRRGPGPTSHEEWLTWTLRAKADGAAVGSLQATVDPIQRRAYIAYTIAVDRWGQGLASEAVARLVAWLLERPDVEAVDAVIDRRNVRSVRTVERLGFAPVPGDPRPPEFHRSSSHEVVYRKTREPPAPSP